MRLAFLADFWPWYNGLPSTDKIALWALGANLIAVLCGVVVGIFAARYGAKHGAEAAFKLARKQQKQDLEDKQYGALVAAKYTLAGQWNILEGYRTRQMEPRRNLPNRFMRFPRYYAPDTAMAVTINDLAFITETVDANLLLEIDITQQRYLSSLVVIRRVTEEIIARDNNPNVKLLDINFDTGDTKLKADMRELFQLKATVDAMYEHLDKAIPCFLETIDKIEAFIGKYFKRQSFKLILKKDLDDTAKVAEEVQHQQPEA